MPPAETGDLAYRGTFTREQLEGFNDERINEMIDRPMMCNWLGENKHAIFYPLRNNTEYNLVILYVGRGTQRGLGSILQLTSATKPDAPMTSPQMYARHKAASTR